MRAQPLHTGTFPRTHSLRTRQLKIHRHQRHPEVLPLLAFQVLRGLTGVHMVVLPICSQAGWVAVRERCCGCATDASNIWRTVHLGNCMWCVCIDSLRVSRWLTVGSNFRNDAHGNIHLDARCTNGVRISSGRSTVRRTRYFVFGCGAFRTLLNIRSSCTARIYHYSENSLLTSKPYSLTVIIVSRAWFSYLIYQL